MFALSRPIKTALQIATRPVSRKTTLCDFRHSTRANAHRSPQCVRVRGLRKSRLPLCLASNDRGGASGGPLNPVAPEQCLESSAEEGPPKGSRFPPREIGRDLGRLSRDGLASQPGDDANGQPVRERDPETLAASTSSRGSGGWSDRPSDGSFHSFSRSLRPPLPPLFLPRFLLILDRLNALRALPRAGTAAAAGLSCHFSPSTWRCTVRPVCSLFFT